MTDWIGKFLKEVSSRFRSIYSSQREKIFSVPTA